MSGTATAPQVAVVVSPRDWAERFHRFVADHGGARVRARVLDAREALSEPYAVLVCEDLTSFLTPRLVLRLQRQGRRVLGVYDPREPQGRTRLLELGVDDVLPETVEPDQLLRAVEALAAAVSADLDSELRDLVDQSSPATPAPGPRAPLVAIGGPPGGPGATEVAVALANLAAERSPDVALVDLDLVAPAIAQRLDLPLEPNLRTAVDGLEHAEPLEMAWHVGETGLRIVAGLADARDWTWVRPSQSLDLLDELARSLRLVLIDVGHRLEGLDPGQPSELHRYGVARAAVSAADAIVAVAEPTPVGVARLLEWVAEVRAISDAPIHVVVNRCPRSGFVRADVEGEILRAFPADGMWMVPEDPQVAHAAWQGAPVRRRSRFCRALALVLDQLEVVSVRVAGSRDANGHVSWTPR